MTQTEPPPANDPVSAEQPTADQTAASLTQLAVDLGPLLIFVVSFNILNRIRPHDAIYFATGIFIVATLAAIAYSWFKTRYIPPVLIVTGVLVTIFGGLTIYLHDDNFVKIKPTVLYSFFAVAIFGSLLFGQNVWKLLLQHTFVLPDRIWRVLAIRWACFFVFMAILNEVIRHYGDTSFWANSRLFITFPLTIVFAGLNAPLTLKYAGRTDEELSNKLHNSQN